MSLYQVQEVLKNQESKIVPSSIGYFSGPEILLKLWIATIDEIAPLPEFDD